MRLAVFLVSFVLFSEVTIKAWAAEEFVIPLETRKKIPIEFYSMIDHGLWGPIPYEKLQNGNYFITVILDQEGSAVIEMRGPDDHNVFVVTNVPEEIRIKGKEFLIRK